MDTNEVVDSVMRHDTLPQIESGDWSQYIKYITEENAIPEDVRKQFWAFSDFENSLSNLNEADVKRLMNNLEITFTFFLMVKPPRKYDIADELMFWQLKNKFFVKMKRSKDGFERKMQATQIREVFTDSHNAPQGGVKGMISRIFGR